MSCDAIGEDLYYS